MLYPPPHSLCSNNNPAPHAPIKTSSPPAVTRAHTPRWPRAARGPHTRPPPQPLPQPLPFSLSFISRFLRAASLLSRSFPPGCPLRPRPLGRRCTSAPPSNMHTTHTHTTHIAPYINLPFPPLVPPLAPSHSYHSFPFREEISPSSPPYLHVNVCLFVFGPSSYIAVHPARAHTWPDVASALCHTTQQRGAALQSIPPPPDVHTLVERVSDNNNQHAHRTVRSVRQEHTTTRWRMWQGNEGSAGLTCML